MAGAIGRARLMPCDRPCTQVVLEVIEEQVARGSRIYESGHFVVLVWGNSQRDLEAVERILSQARCSASLFVSFRRPHPCCDALSTIHESSPSAHHDRVHCSPASPTAARSEIGLLTRRCARRTGRTAAGWWSSCRSGRSWTWSRCTGALGKGAITSIGL